MNLNHDKLPGFAPIRITLPDGEVIVLDSYVDDQKVRRFVSNAIIDRGHDDGLFDLNRIAAWCFRNNVPIKDRIHFWAMLGYSVSWLSGLVNIVPMDKCRVETPDWSGGPFDDDGNEYEIKEKVWPA